MWSCTSTIGKIKEEKTVSTCYKLVILQNFSFYMFQLRARARARTKKIQKYKLN